jgi:hypothetical protein
MFGDLAPEPVRRPKNAVRPKKAPKAVYTKYRPVKATKCDECMQVLVETGGTGPVARVARWKRKQGTDVAYLCSAHTQALRDLDGLDPLKEV